MRGTGSNDLVVRDVFVPEEHTFSFQDAQLVKRSGPLYAFPFMFIAKGPGTALGRQSVRRVAGQSSTQVYDFL
jgi:hypothetical protein